MLTHQKQLNRTLEMSGLYVWQVNYISRSLLKNHAVPYRLYIPLPSCKALLIVK